jgi:hypothetical protein
MRAAIVALAVLAFASIIGMATISFRPGSGDEPLQPITVHTPGVESVPRAPLSPPSEPAAKLLPPAQAPPAQPPAPAPQPPARTLAPAQPQPTAARPQTPQTRGPIWAPDDVPAPPPPVVGGGDDDDGGFDGDD